MKFTQLVVAALVAGALSLGYGCKSSGSDTINPNAGAGAGAGNGPATVQNSGLGNENFVKGGGENLPHNGLWEKIPGLHLGTIYFAFDSDRIQASERAKLEDAAEYMKKNQTVGMIIEGNCDERGTAEYNRALGERRALAIRTYLIGLGVQENRFQTISYGSERPAVLGHNEEAWAKNRRGELDGAKMK